MKADAEKKRRRDLELEQIVEADRISRQIQKEQRRMRQQVEAQKQNEERSQGNSKSTIVQIERQSDTPVTSIAGRKRKSHANGVLNGTLSDPANAPAHKRSRTLGNSPSTSASQSQSQSSISHFTNRDSRLNLRRSLSQKSLRQSVGEETVDKTRTDYFRLIAYGLDPKTPLVPLTRAQVEEQKKRKAEKDAATIARFTRGRTRSAKKVEELVTSNTAVLSPSLETPHPAHRQEESLQQRAAYNPVDDPVLKQLRETRKTLAEDSEWFKEQTAVLAQEIEQQEEFRRSLSQSQSSNSSFGLSVNGFARSVNGYEYVPPDLKPGQTLSRTEERIRQTGARGLATKPIGGSSRSTYTPVAMSKKSALRYSQGVVEDSSKSRKLIIDEVDQSNGMGSHSHTAHSVKTITPSQQQPVKKSRNHELPITSSFGYIVSVDGGTGHESGEEEEDDEDQVLNENPEQNSRLSYDDDLYVEEDEEYLEDDQDQDQDQGDDEAEEEENEEEEDDDDDELYRGGRQPYNSLFETNDYATEELQEDEQDESDGDEDSAYLASYGYGLQAPAPFSRHGSQALSGVATPDTGAGASADDAIELSD